MNCEDYGYIVLVKGAGDKDTEPVDQSFFRWLQSEVTLPTINKIREDVFKPFNWKTGDPVPPGMEALGQIDLTLARSNIGTMAAILVRKMHCKKKICEHIPRDRWEECLLTRSTTKFIQAIGASRMLEGCYLYHHRNSKVADEDADDDTAFVRSGKAASGHTTRNIGVRYQDAQTCALLLHDNPTLFQLSYPAAQVTPSPHLKRGDFEDVTQFVGIAFDPSSPGSTDALCTPLHDIAGIGIFVWSQEVMVKLQSHDWNGLSMKQKQLNMLAFTWELVYELMLAPKDNCSESPGFERFLRDFSRNE